VWLWHNGRMSDLDLVIPPQLIARLRGARHVAVLTGAGISAESGIATFRDTATGLWARFNPEEVATLEAFRRTPGFVWRWYAERRQVIGGAEPNAAHRALVELEARVPAFTLITQNIDDLHRRAGSRNIVELHGNIHRARCLDEGTRVESWADTADPPPRCPDCGGMLRPDVVWFGEMLPLAAINAAFAVASSCDVFLSVGTSGTVEPAASLAYEALRSDAVVVEVNSEETPLTPSATYVLQGPAGEVLPALLAAGWAGGG